MYGHWVTSSIKIEINMIKQIKNELVKLIGLKFKKWIISTTQLSLNRNATLAAINSIVYSAK